MENSLQLESKLMISGNIQLITVQRRKAKYSDTKYKSVCMSDVSMQKLRKNYNGPNQLNKQRRKEKMKMQKKAF